MKCYDELVNQFYEEFPEAVGFVAFYNEKRPSHYLDVTDEKFIAIHRIIKNNGGNVTVPICTATSDFRMVNGCIVAMRKEPTIKNPLAKFYNQAGLHENGPMEQEFIFHHETFHAIKMLQYGPPREDFTRKFHEECAADAYATLRLLNEHGDNALPLLRLLANRRIIMCQDAVHMTTFTVDRAVLVGCGLQDVQHKYGKLTPDQFVEMAENMADKDEIYQIVKQAIDYEIPDVKDMIGAIQFGTHNGIHHPDWMSKRFDQAFFVLSDAVVHQAHPHPVHYKDVTPA